MNFISRLSLVCCTHYKFTEGLLLSVCRATQKQVSKAQQLDQGTMCFNRSCFVFPEIIKTTRMHLRFCWKLWNINKCIFLYCLWLGTRVGTCTGSQEKWKGKKKKRELNNFPLRTARELNDRSILSGRKSQGRADDHDCLILACCTAELVATFSRRQHLTTSELEL